VRAPVVEDDLPGHILAFGHCKKIPLAETIPLIPPIEEFLWKREHFIAAKKFHPLNSTNRRVFMNERTRRNQLFRR
jgi:hypothetical protein